MWKASVSRTIVGRWLGVVVLYVIVFLKGRVLAKMVGRRKRMLRKKSKRQRKGWKEDTCIV